MSGYGQVGEQNAVLVENDGSRRDEHYPVLPRSPVPARAFTMTSARGLDVGMVVNVEKRSDGGVGSEYHAAPVAAVATLRPSLGLVGLALKRNGTVASVSGLNLYSSFIYKGQLELPNK